MTRSEHSAVDRVLRHAVMGPYIRAMSRLSVVGRDLVPPTGPLILVANHRSFSDSLVLPLAVRRPVYFLGKQEYFETPGVRGRALAAFMGSMGVVPVDRSGGRAAVAVLDTAQQILSEGRVFGIYPEGTRSPDGLLHRGRTGAARLALASGARVVPCGITGTDRLQPLGARLLHPAHVRVSFGAPVEFADLDPDIHPNRRIRAMTDQMMTAIRALSAQTYLDEYARSSTTPDPA